VQPPRSPDVDLADPNFDRTRGVRASALHPGGIMTELGRHLQPGELEATVERINARLAIEGRPPFKFKTIPQGVATSVWAAFVAAAEEVGGRYCEDCHVSLVDQPGEPRGQAIRP
jgi:NAD(P)-dependent dehydrogenase (short-subunit alcohol dehydrogenase family)